MNKYDIVFSKSSNHGATWTAPIEVSGQPWGDKPWIGVSPDGVHVYIAYATSSDVWVAASHNSGASFSAAVKLNNDNSRYRYPNGLEVLANGTAVLSASDYPGGSQQTSRAINIETWRTTNGGVSWTRTVLGQVFTGVNFETSSTTALGERRAGTLVALYTGATTQGGNGHVWSRRSTDGGLTWAPAIELGNGTANASFPAIAGGAAGTVPHPLRRRPHRRVEHLLPHVDRRRADLERGDRHLRCRHGRLVQDRRRVRLGVRRLRRDRHHEHRQGRRRLGRGRELLGRPRRHLVQPPLVAKGAAPVAMETIGISRDSDSHSTGLVCPMEPARELAVIRPPCSGVAGVASLGRGCHMGRDSGR